MPLGDREAIAVYTDYDFDLSNLCFQLLCGGVEDLVYTALDLDFTKGQRVYKA